MHTDSTACYYVALYTGPELRQLRATACAELAGLSTAPVTTHISEQESTTLTDLLDRIRLYTAALLVQQRQERGELVCA